MAVSPFLCNLHAGSVPSSLRESPTHALPFLSFSPSIIAETVTFCQRAGREEGPRKHFRVLPDANHHAPLIMQREDHQSFSPSTASCLLMEDAESKSGEAFSCSTEDERSASRRSSFESKTDAKVDDERTDHSGGEQVSRLKGGVSKLRKLEELLLFNDLQLHLFRDRVDEGAALQVAAGGRHVGLWQRGMHCAGHLQCSHQSLW